MGFATLVLEWEKSETEKEIFETTKALEWEIDISRLYYKGLEQNTNYRLVSMVRIKKKKKLKQSHKCLFYFFLMYLSVTCSEYMECECRLDMVKKKENTYAWLMKRAGGSISDVSL